MSFNVTLKAFRHASEFPMIITCSLRLARFSYRPMSKHSEKLVSLLGKNPDSPENLRDTKKVYVVVCGCVWRNWKYQILLILKLEVAVAVCMKICHEITKSLGERWDDK